MITRAIARKLKIKTILNAPYIAGNDIEHPNHLLINDEKVIRVNTIGGLKEKYENPEANYSSIIIDEEGNEIKVKFFEHVNLSDYKEGDFVKVIGKIRQQGKERYILGEVIKKIPKDYKDIREKELFTNQLIFEKKSNESVNINQQEEKIQKQEVNGKEEKKDNNEVSQEVVIEDLGEITE